MDKMVKAKMVEIIKVRALKEYGEAKLAERIEKAKAVLPGLEGNKFYDNMEYVLEFCWQNTPEDKGDDVDVNDAMYMLIADDAQTEYTQAEFDKFDDAIDFYTLDDIILAKWDMLGDI